MSTIIKTCPWDNRAFIELTFSFESSLYNEFKPMGNLTMAIFPDGVEPIDHNYRSRSFKLEPRNYTIESEDKSEFVRHFSENDMYGVTWEFCLPLPSSINGEAYAEDYVFLQKFEVGNCNIQFLPQVKSRHIHQIVRKVFADVTDIESVLFFTPRIITHSKTFSLPSKKKLSLRPNGR